MQPLPGQPSSDSTFLTIAQLAISGLGMVFSFLGAALLFVLGFVSVFSESQDLATLVPIFGLAWITLLVGILAVPSVLYSIQRLRGKKYASPSLPGFRLSSLLLLLWPLVLVLGNLIAPRSELAWLLLPPLQILAIGLPVWWLLEMARRKLSVGTRQRGWGLINFSILITTPALMFVEIVVFGLLLLLFVMWVNTQPELLNQLETFGRRLLDVQDDPEAMLQLLQPYLENPWVVFSILAIIAGLVPLIEELLKPLGIWLLAGRRLTPAQGFIAGALCGGSFALIESLFYLSNPVGEGWAGLAFGRAGTGLLHITTSALVGWAMAKAWNGGSYFQLLLSYLAAAALHGLWNGISILSGLSGLLQSPPEELRFLNSLSLIAPAILGVLVVVLFAILWGINRKLRLSEPVTISQPLSEIYPS